MRTREALAFDVYGTLVDPIELRQSLERLLPGDGARIAELWRQKQLEYTFRLTAMERYEPFDAVTLKALAYALAATGRTLDEAQQEALIAEYDHLPPYADVEPGLQQLRDAGHELAVFSNGAPAMLEALLANTGLRSSFAQVISVHDTGAYKPSPKVYRHAAHVLGRSPGEVRLISSNPFDVIGAEHAGLQAAWINRSGQVFDTLAPPPDVVVRTIAELAVLLC